MSVDKDKQNMNKHDEVESNDLVNLYAEIEEEENESVEEVEELDLETLYQNEESTETKEVFKEEAKEVFKEEAKDVFKEEAKDNTSKKGRKKSFFSKKSKQENLIEETNEIPSDNKDNKKEEVAELLSLMDETEGLEEIEPQALIPFNIEDNLVVGEKEVSKKGVFINRLRGAKANEVYEETDAEKRTRIKRKRVFLGSGIFSVVASCYLIFHIFVWWNNNHYNNSTLGFIKDTEVVGVSVDPTAGLSVEAEKVDIALAKTYPFIDVDFQRLKERNSDTVGWLKVGAVDLDVPLVQTTDNDYYLTHDFDGNVNALGWIFTDARSNMEVTGFNTVLYGHNAATRTMFGSLKGLLEITDPEMREAKETIQMNTLYTKGVYEIVSVYITTFDDWTYVQQNFNGTEEKQAFINRMRERNKVKVFDREDLTTSDRFLTFSTCHGPAGTENRLVVVARLIAEK